MADITTDQNFPNVVLTIMDTQVPPKPAMVDGVPVWASSDETVLTVVPGTDGMTAVVSTVAPGTGRITVSADADLGAGVIPITGVSEDITVALGASHMASVMALNLGSPAAKV